MFFFYWVQSAVIGGFAYNSHLDKEYAALSLAAPQVTEPPPPAAEEDAVEEVTQNEPITVVVTPPAHTSDQRPVRERADDRRKRLRLNSLLRLRPVVSPPGSRQPAPLPPRAVASPDVRAGGDPRHAGRRTGRGSYRYYSRGRAAAKAYSTVAGRCGGQRSPES